MATTSHDHLSAVQQRLQLATTKQNTFQVSIEEFRRMQTQLLELREALYAAQDREAKLMHFLEKSNKNRTLLSEYRYDADGLGFWIENIFHKNDVTATLKENLALRRELDMKEQQVTPTG